MGTQGNAQTRAGRYLLVATGAHRCALPIGRVRGIVPSLGVFPLPTTDPNLLGLAEYAGEPLPVFDLAGVVGAPPGGAAEFPVTVVVWVGSEQEREAVALAADGVLRLAELPVTPHEAGTGEVVDEVVELDGTVVHVLDLATFRRTR